jgi:hypothetical protein
MGEAFVSSALALFTPRVLHTLSDQIVLQATPKRSEITTELGMQCVGDRQNVRNPVRFRR